jgi:hypothetical protein
MRIAAKNHRFGTGLICGTLRDGRRAYTNGHLLLVGEPRKNVKRCEFPGKLGQALDLMVPYSLIPARKKSKKHFATDKPFTVIVFHDGTGADEKYLNEIKSHFPRSRLFLGKQVPGRSGRYIIAKQDEKIVALLAPVRWR